MAQPPAYNRVKDFGADYPDQTDNQAINTELDAVSASVNGIRTNLALIQRDDGGLRDGIVTKDSLAQALKDDLYAEFSGNINDSVLEAQQAAADATNAAAAANADAATASAAQQAAQTASMAALASASAASASQSGAFTSANAASASATSAGASATAASASASSASTAKTAAEAARDAAVQARDQAVPAAATATTKAAEAVGSATSASNSANLAQQWATKLGGTVDGSEFSAKHYAELAAQGMGLPIFPASGIPSTNQGPIFVPGQGPMGWDGSRYTVTNGEHGQCRFVFVSTTECRLMPYNGDGVVANGRQLRVPTAGIAIASTALQGATGTTNYIYLYDNAGTPMLEASTTAHSRHTDGVEIKTGDPTRTLVGVAYKAAGGQFINTAALRGVASWFNRYYPSANATNFNTGTASVTAVQAISPVYVWTWEGESTMSNVNGRKYVNVAGASAYTYLYDDGNQSWSAAGTSVSANAALPVSLTVQIDSRVEGFHGVSTWLSVSGGGTSNCALTQSIIARP